MQHASLIQTPGRHLLAGTASLQRPQRCAFSVRSVAKMDRRVSQATPQPKVEECQTYLGEKYWRVQPFRNGQQADYRDPASRYTPPQICLKNLNHVALEAVDPLGLTDFYTRVLGFKSIKRPNLPFEGSWLEGAGLLVHIIAEDPSVPKKIHNWKEQYAEQPPASWYIRRANHLAFEVEDSDAMEERLVHFGIEYTKAVVPDVDVAQLFFFDPEG
ncbi:hypothetical protein ABBQ32_002694 [Trebouxia sp. C0010 RCD-2024]